MTIAWKLAGILLRRVELELVCGERARAAVNINVKYPEGGASFRPRL